jgi:hypothetical protein
VILRQEIQEASFFRGLIICGCVFFPAIGEYIKENIGGEELVPARPQRMVVGGGVFSEDGRGRAWIGPILSNLIISTEKRCYKKYKGNRQETLK